MYGEFGSCINPDMMSLKKNRLKSESERFARAQKGHTPWERRVGVMKPILYSHVQFQNHVQKSLKFSRR